jgi:hypothetical protein
MFRAAHHAIPAAVRWSVATAVTALLVALPGSLRAGEADNWQQNHPEWLWCDDFESADTTLSRRYQDVSTNGFSVVTGESFDGSQSLRQHYMQGQVDAGWIIRVNDTGFPDHIFVRWYHKFETGFQGFPPKMARVRYRDHTTWVSTFGVHCWLETDGVLALDVAAPNSSQANSTGWLPIARSVFSFANSQNVGRWICFEMEAQLNTPGSTDGLYRLWENDTLLAERTGVDLRGTTTQKINEVMLDCYWNGGSPKPQNRYYDNFVISTKKIGPYKGAGSIKSGGRQGDAPLAPKRKATVRVIRRATPASFDFIVTSQPGPMAALLYDVRGNRILALASRFSTTGTERISWDGRGCNGTACAPGAYLVEVRVNNVRAGGLLFAYERF